MHESAALLGPDRGTVRRAGVGCRHSVGMVSCWAEASPLPGLEKENTMQGRRSLAGAVASIGASLSLAPRRAAAQATAPAPAESTLDRVRRTGVLRISALPGEAPFFKR